VIPWCAANGVAFVAFGVLGRGFLTGALTPGQEFPKGDFRATNPRFQPDAMAANVAILDGSDGSPSASARPRHRSPWPGCSPRASTCSRSRERSASATSRKTWAAGRLSWMHQALAELDGLPAPVGARYA
jgi:hypothetical protein